MLLLFRLAVFIHFVVMHYSLVGQSCGKCKQTYVKCNSLKKENFRYE